ncbi:DsrE/DsrF/DrsH-like family protein [bacterium]
MREKTTLVVFSSDLDKIIAAFNIAIGSASMDMDVTMFFTFWGLNVLRKKRSVKKHISLLKRLLNFFNRGGVDRLKLSKFNMMGMGTYMMKLLMKKSKMPSVQELITLAKELGVKFVACSTTMEMLGVKSEDLIPEVNTIAGVSTYISNAKQSKINLFI